MSTQNIVAYTEALIDAMKFFDKTVLPESKISKLSEDVIKSHITDIDFRIDNLNYYLIELKKAARETIPSLNKLISKNIINTIVDGNKYIEGMLTYRDTIISYSVDKYYPTIFNDFKFLMHSFKD